MKQKKIQNGRLKKTEFFNYPQNPKTPKPQNPIEMI